MITDGAGQQYTGCFKMSGLLYKEQKMIIESVCRQGTACFRVEWPI